MNGQTELANTGAPPQMDSALSAVTAEAGVLSAIAREEAELKGQIFMAKSYPRDETAAAIKVRKACGNPTFADGCVYSFPRGGSTISGPSVKLAREIARYWPNLKYGLRIVASTADTVHIKGYCFDLEMNTLVEAEDQFAKLIQRRVKGADGERTTQWIMPDERDLRELVNRRGAILVRNCILQLTPSWLTDEAIAECRKTMNAVARGDLETDKPTHIRNILAAFVDLGVDQQMIERRLGGPMITINEDKLAELRQMFKSITDGNSTVRDYFGEGGGDDEAPEPTKPTTLDGVVDAADGK